jgi:hypothetical protein
MTHFTPVPNIWLILYWSIVPLWPGKFAPSKTSPCLSVLGAKKGLEILRCVFRTNGACGFTLMISAARLPKSAGWEQTDRKNNPP